MAHNRAHALHAEGTSFNPWSLQLKNLSYQDWKTPFESTEKQVAYL